MYQESSCIDDKPSHHMEQTDSNVIVSPNKSTNATGTNLLHLNDDCLLEIFSSNLLTPLDLCALAETCTRFKRITHQACPKHFRSITNYCGSGYKFFSKNHSNYTTGRGAEQILKTFGSCFSTISMQWHDSVAVDWIAEHCSDGKLKILKIYRFAVDESLVIELRSILSQLLALHITASFIRPGANIDIDCARLVELEIVNVAGCDAVFNNTFPVLQRLTFVDDKYDGTNALTFIGRHNGLRTLTLDTVLIYRTFDFAHVIGESVMELQELSLRNFNSLHIALDFSSLEGPTKLNMLDVSLGYKYYSQIVALLRAFKSLEIVKLSMGLLQDEARSVLVAPDGQS